MRNLLNQHEGWDVFYCAGSVDGVYQIQRVDDEKKFADDDEAGIFVIGRAVIDKNQRAIEALKEVFDESPASQEWLRLCKIAKDRLDYDLMEIEFVKQTLTI